MDPEESPRLRPIRFAILAPGTILRAWQVRSIEALLAQLQPALTSARTSRTGQRTRIGEARPQ